MAENASLRESLVMMQKELVAVLNEKSAELSMVLCSGHGVTVMHFHTNVHLCGRFHSG